jgi:integrase
MAINKIHRKKGIVYRVKVPLPGNRVASRCFDRKVDAEKFEADTKSNLRVAAQEKIRFEDFAVKFIELCAEPNMEKSSVKKYQGLIKNYYNPRFARFYLKEITRYHLFEFKAEIQKLESSGSLKYMVISGLKTIFKRAVELNFLERDPSLGLRVPKQSLPRTEYWNADEIAKFLNSVRNNSRLPLYMLALNTGMRLGELFALKWDCVDLKNSTLTVRRTWCQKSNAIKESTKTNLKRSFKINQVLAQYLKELKLKSTSERVLDGGQMGCRNPAHASRAFAIDSIKAGVRVIKFHDLRHTFATQFVRNNGSIHAISGILGHTSTAMTDRYAHFGAEHAAQAAEIVSFAPAETGNILKLNGHKTDTKAV